MYHTAPGKFFNEIHVKTFRTIRSEQGIFIMSRQSLKKGWSGISSAPGTPQSIPMVLEETPD
jgi:hypothetical protein